jgi:hypothetical protein
VERYLEVLGIDNERYYAFILALIDRAIKKNIGMSSVMSSKIVGAIWILVQREKLPIDANMIQDRCDNIKKNTWTRFSDAITNNILKFYDIFAEHKIETGIKGRVVRRSEIEGLTA